MIQEKSVPQFLDDLQNVSDPLKMNLPKKVNFHSFRTP